MSPLSPIDFPSLVFDLESNWEIETMKRQTKILNSIVRILVNPFNDLEFDAFRILKNVTIMGTCPSIPSNFLDDNPFVDDMIDISSKIIWIYWF